MNLRDKLWAKDFVLLSLSCLFLFLSFEMLMPALPIYIAEIGGNTSEIGMVMGCFTITAVMIRPFSGYAANRLGTKLLLIAGGILCLVATGLYYVAVTVLWVLIIRLLHGLGFGIATTLYGTIVADLIPSSRMGEGMGYFGLANTIAISIGPFLGVVIIDNGGYKTLILVSTVILVLACLFNLIVKTSSSSKQANDIPMEKKESVALSSQLIEKKAIFPSILGMMAGFSFGGILSFITLYGKEIGVSNIGYFFLVVSIFEVLVRFVSGRLFDRKGPMWVIFPSAILSFIATIILSYASSMTVMLIAASFYGLGFGALFPALQAWVINRVEPSRRGSATATFFNLFDIGIAGGAVLLGFIAGITSFSTMFRISSLFYMALICICIVYEFISIKKRVMIGKSI